MSAGATAVNNANNAAQLQREICNKTTENMAVNELDEIVSTWTSISVHQQPIIVAIAMDNAGPEMMADFVLAEFLLSSRLADRVIFLPKMLPWFVSDVTPADVDWLLVDALSSSPSSTGLKQWAKRWTSRFQDGSFAVSLHPFWTMPLGYNELHKKVPELYRQLTEVFSVVIFKVSFHFSFLKDFTTVMPRHDVLRCTASLLFLTNQCALLTRTLIFQLFKCVPT